MRRFTKKRVIGVLTAVSVFAIAAGAIAYFTNTGGTATGSGSVGNSSAWNVTATSFTGGPLYPGSGTETGTTTVTNTSAGNEFLSTITATIAAPTNTGSIAGDPACTAADFSLATGNGWTAAAGGQSATYTVNADEPGTTAAGGAGSVTSGALTLSMNDLQHIQDNCQGATPNVTYTVS